MPLLEKVIAHFKLDMFDKIYSESTLGIGKNDTKFFESILKDLDTTADNVFLFVDSCTSIKNAIKNGILITLPKIYILFILLTYGYT